MSARFKAGLGFCIAVALAVFPAIAMAAPVTVSGQVTYRERMALPVNAVLSIALVDLTNRNARPTVHAEARIGGSGHVPFSFSLNFDDDVVIPDHKYGVSARILSGTATLFSNPQPYPIDPLAPAAAEAMITLVHVGNPPSPAVPAPVAPQPVQPVAELIGHTWRIEAIDGAPVIANAPATFDLADDGRAGGKGGCNSYFAQAEVSGTAISFGPPAATRMACDEPVMAQETKFFASLAAIRSFALADDTLRFLDENGGEVLRLARSRQADT